MSEMIIDLSNNGTNVRRRQFEQSESVRKLVLDGGNVRWRTAHNDGFYWVTNQGWRWLTVAPPHDFLIFVEVGGGYDSGMCYLHLSGVEGQSWSVVSFDTSAFTPYGRGFVFIHDWPNEGRPRVEVTNNETGPFQPGRNWSSERGAWFAARAFVGQTDVVVRNNTTGQTFTIRIEVVHK